MLNTANLSLEQAPPISIPLRFFLTAPIFGVAAGVLLLWYGPDVIASRWTPQALALTHLLTLGFMALVMTGALLQMLPVLAGIPVPKVVLVGKMAHSLISIGTLALAGGFLFGSILWLKIAVFALGAGFAIYILAVTAALWRVKIPNATVSGMRMAILALVVTVIIGLTLGSGLSGMSVLSQPLMFTDVHLTWGMLGWVALLLIGVSFQVVPMFQVTPEYPEWMRNWMPRMLLIGLAIWTMLYVSAVTDQTSLVWPFAWMLVLIVGYSAFAIITLRLQQQRRRKITDVTLLFWRVGMSAIPISFIIWGLARMFPGQSIQLDMLLGACMIFGAAVPLLNGMLYKIVPFLSWFHLQNRQLAMMCMTVTIPNMKQFLPDKYAKWQFQVYMLALATILIAIFFPGLMTRISGLLLAISFAMLAWNLAQVVIRYRQVNTELMAAAESMQDNQPG